MRAVRVPDHLPAPFLGLLPSLSSTNISVGHCDIILLNVNLSPAFNTVPGLVRR